jgi:hypothetical protein
MSLLHIHIGKVLPGDNYRSLSYIYDSIYQSLLIGCKNKIYVLLDDTLIQEFNNTLCNFNINTVSVITIPLSVLGDLPKEYIDYINSLPKDLSSFRDSFWISTTSRFFYIEKFIELFKLRNVFHIENDIMLYETTHNILKILDQNEMYMVQDSKTRVIPSIIFIPNVNSISKLNKYILKTLMESCTTGLFMNDMELLGSYPFKNLFDFDPTDTTATGNLILDGASFGQFLGGVDPRNLNPPADYTNTVCNPKIGFINETCDFKLDNPNVKIFFKKSIGSNLQELIIPFSNYNSTSNQTNYLKRIANLHIHSKQLYQYSSKFNLKYIDLITGDRIADLCDFVIMTHQIYDFHKSLKVDNSKILIISDWKTSNLHTKLNMIFTSLNKKTIKLHIYTHILDDFINVIYQLDNKLDFKLYLHNSDHSLNNTELHKKLIDKSNIVQIFSQNVNCEINDKVNLLPIGFGNSMWNHGNLEDIYSVINSTYLFKKSKGIYININPSTFNYRSKVLSQVNNERFNKSTSKPFKEYMQELSTHRFCLCVRGNGIETHRFHEALYLGVIPVIINNKFTNMDNHVQYLEKLGLPFYQITSESLEKYSDDFFNEALYNKITKGLSITNLPQLKLSYYS